jgi:hypothetical protein
VHLALIYEKVKFDLIDEKFLKSVHGVATKKNIIEQFQLKITLSKTVETLFLELKSILTTKKYFQLSKQSFLTF